MQDNNKVLQIKEKSPRVIIITAKQTDTKDRIHLQGLCATKMRRGKGYIDTAKLVLETEDGSDALSISFASKWGKKLPKGFALNKYEIIVDKNKAKFLDIQNKLVLRYDGQYLGRIMYSAKDGKVGKNNNMKVVMQDGISMYFRQTPRNSLWFVVRESNYYDTEEGQQAIADAVKASKSLDGNFILMYEKECEHYEESASVLYEKMIDMGYRNIFYVVNFDNPRIQELKPEYRANLVNKGSKEHLTRYFACKTIISTETTEHAVQLRIASKSVRDKMLSSDLQYVFLQHGVMYMVSLNSSLRVAFRRSPHKLNRTVVSSELEAEHFITLGGKDREELYVTGLAKFDRSVRKSGADKILIMPTWRRWEHNQAKSDNKDTGYYRLVKDMYDAVPAELKEKTIILPHPLMADAFEQDDTFDNRVVLGVSYEEMLQDCEVLITDYSSIAYDAFYRGAKVVFCWQDKDECMKHYGEGSYLMLNEDNCFGDVCMNKADINKAVSDAYGKPRKQEYMDKFSRIVEFSDGRNSERIIECLKADGIL